MSSEFLTWGLLIGVVGMIWVLMIATINEMSNQKTQDRSFHRSGDEPGGAGQVRREATSHDHVAT